MPIRMRNQFISNDNEEVTPLSILTKHVPAVGCSDSSVHTSETASLLSDLSDDWSQYSSNSSNTASSEKPKSVSFAPTASFRYTISRSEYTREERRSAFFTSDEYNVIAKECIKQVHKMENGNILKDKKYCSRGLENHTRTGSMSRQENREMAYIAVLSEQAQLDDETMSELYHSISSSCQLWAFTVGLRDQRDAEDYLFDI